MIFLLFSILSQKIPLGDGATDKDEIRAGTNPDDPASFLHFTSITQYEGQGILLEWTSTIERVWKGEAGF